jgi:hypothetical protein
MQSISLGESYLLTLLMAWGCARPAPIAADSGRSPNEVIAVALVGSHVVARTEAYRVRVWNLETNSVSELDREHVVDMANDGSVAVSADPFGKYGRLIEAWNPLSQRSLGTQRFEHGAVINPGVVPPMVTGIVEHSATFTVARTSKNANVQSPSSEGKRVYIARIFMRSSRSPRRQVTDLVEHANASAVLINSSPPVGCT